MLFLVYPAMIPTKYGPNDPTMTTLRNVPIPDDIISRRARRIREETDGTVEGVGEAVSTAAAALKAERYRPKIFGFQVHEIAKLMRWQEAVRDK
jgi:casein kinase II subunit beta